MGATSRGLAVLAVLAVMGCGARPAMSTGASGAGRKGVPAVATDGGDRSCFGGAVNTMAEQRFPEVYAGVQSCRDPSAVTVVFVVRGRDISSFRAALDELKAVEGPGNDYRIVPVAHSYADLDRMTMKIAADSDALEKAGIHLASWGPNYDSNKVEITLLYRYDAAAAAALIDKYGDEWVTVSPVPETQIPTVQ